ncbi:heavy metal sensor histidine kinase [Pseudothauera rhizosphaerae]|uniref:Sensor protein n=1 Tax=Pseudothauera rhizosphaerae TaxID=2565932 RepID=A0A4S4AW94_9RHOO|nr:heavy metal sensor histidine kinase [Pseudothauera rhizosphaerae]THF64304.1 heavy metal sensor histidine kinase [Pseudothauera rhizosphaerae]
MARPVSLTARIALLFALLTASLLIVVGAVLGRAVEAHFRELDQHELAGKLTLIQNLLQGTGDPRSLGQRLDDAFVGHDLVGVLLRDADGAIVHAIQPGHFPPAQLDGAALPAGAALWEKDGHQYIGRETFMPLPGTAPDAGLRVAVGLDISHHAHFLEQVRNRLWLGISLAAVVAALFGWLAAYKGLAPLRRVTATARRLSAEQLGERLAEQDAPAEVRELADALNGMFDRLEASFRRLADFSADIAHELRTPVSNLMTQTQVALSRARSADEYRDILASNMEEYERIARMVSDMLFLAQAENGRLPRPVETVELAAEARALAEFYEALADEKEVAIAVEGEAAVTGDRLMLRRALANLLSNALRHAEAGSTVDIAIAHGEADATLTVGNRGETIPPEQLSQIFDRFHRATTARRQHGEGAGLGLAITRSIVELHGGTVDVSSADGFTAFRLRLPLARTTESR